MADNEELIDYDEEEVSQLETLRIEWMNTGSQ